MDWIIAGLVTAIVGVVASVGTGIANVSEQRKANEQNVELQKTAWDKNSYQSRVEDANKAGISKWLVANGTPSYSLNTQIKSPDFSQIGSGFGKLSDTFSGVIDKQSALQNTINAKAQYDNIISTKNLLDAQTRGQNIKNLMNAWDFAKYQERGIASNDTGFLKDITALMTSLGMNQPSKAGQLKNVLDNMGARPDIDNLAGDNEFMQGIVAEAKEEYKRTEAIKKSKKYGDAWRTNDYNIGAIKYNPHYK